MTPQEFIARLTRHADALEHREAVDFARQFYPVVVSSLTAAQRRTVDGIVHIAVMAVEMEEASTPAVASAAQAPHIVGSGPKPVAPHRGERGAARSHRERPLPRAAVGGGAHQPAALRRQRAAQAPRPRR
jgi:hypothetical protein